MHRGFWGIRGRRLPLVLVLAAGLPAMGWAASGGVTSSTRTRSYAVEGSTAVGLVRYMNSHPVQGDHGAAYASIHPNYQLSLSTVQKGALCVPRNVEVHVAFELTQPIAASPGKMGGRTRRAWNAFVAFSRAHEAHHRASYLGCAHTFVATAKRQSAGQCFVLESDIRRLLSQMKRDCEAKQVPFDHAQAQVLRRLALFSMARYQAAR